MLRLLRLWRPNTALHRMRAALGAALWSIIRSVCIVALLLHIAACTFHWVAFRRLPGTAAAAADAVAHPVTAWPLNETAVVEVALSGVAPWAGAVTWLEKYRLQDASRVARCARTGAAQQPGLAHRSPRLRGVPQACLHEPYGIPYPTPGQRWNAASACMQLLGIPAKMLHVCLITDAGCCRTYAR